MNDFLNDTYHRLIRETHFTQHRYLYDKFNLNNRLTGLIGARGVGKTTLMLQYIKEHFYPDDKVFYFSADNIYFNTISLLEFINDCYQTAGIRIFFIDEIHKQPHWSQILKNVYDAFPDVKIVFSGSSSIDIIKGTSDLSRRAIIFHLQGLSFREYLNFNTANKIPAISYSELMNNPVEIGIHLSKIPKILGLFRDYLRFGYYPFAFEDLTSYYEKISQVIDKSIYEDIANFYSLKTPHLHCFKNILNYFASIPPGNVSIHSIAKQLALDDKTTFHYLTILAETGLLRFLKPYAKGKQVLSKPQKIFLNNTTLHNAMEGFLGMQTEIGTQRELFFMQSLMNADVKVFASEMADFQVENYLFEIGGKNKSYQQINKSSLPAFLVKDDILIGNQRTIPLFYFGFCY